MPQFDVSTFASQIFWLAVAFGALYWLLAKTVVPRMTSVLEERESRIKGDLEAAEQANQKAQTIAQSYEQVLQDARGKAADILREEAEEGKRELKERQAVAQGAIAHQTEEAEKRISATLESAKEQVGEIAKTITADIVAELGGQKPTAAVLDKALKNAG